MTIAVAVFFFQPLLNKQFISVRICQIEQGKKKDFVIKATRYRELDFLKLEMKLLFELFDK